MPGDLKTGVALNDHFSSRGGQEHESWHASRPMNHLARRKFARPMNHPAQRKQREFAWPRLKKCAIFWRSTLGSLEHEVSVRVFHLASAMVNDRMIHLFRRMSLMVNFYGRFTLWSWCLELNAGSAETIHIYTSRNSSRTLQDGVFIAGLLARSSRLAFFKKILLILGFSCSLVLRRCRCLTPG